MRQQQDGDQANSTVRNKQANPAVLNIEKAGGEEGGHADDDLLSPLCLGHQNPAILSTSHRLTSYAVPG